MTILERGSGGARVRYANRGFERLTGYAPGEIEGRGLQVLWGENTDDAAIAEVTRAIDAGQFATVELLTDTRERVPFWNRLQVTPIEDGDGAFAIAVHRDVTEERRLRSLMRDGDAPLRRVTEELEDVVWIVDGDLERVSYVNPAYESVCGHSRERLYENPRAYLEAIHPDDRKAATEAFQAARKSKRQVEVRLRRPGEGRTWMRMTAVPIFETRAADDPDWIVGIATDVTDLKERERRLAALHDATQEMIHVGSRDEIADRVVRAADEMLDLPLVSVYRYDATDDRLCPVDYAPEVVEVLGDLPTFAGERSIAWEAFEEQSTRVYGDDRDDGTIYGTGAPIQSGLAVPIGRHGVLLAADTAPDAFDESTAEFAEILAMAAEGAIDRTRREEELAYQRSVLEAQQEATIDGVLVVDDGEFVTYNDRFVELWGLPDWVVEAGDDEAALRWVLDQLQNPEEFLEQVEYLYEHPDETSRDEIELIDGRAFDRYSTPIVDVDGTRYGRLWTFRDITDRKERERRLKRQNERLEQLNRLNSVIREVDRALVQSLTRETVERKVCDRLVGTDRYTGAWIAARSAPKRFEFRATAGVERSTLDSFETTPIERVSETHDPTIVHWPSGHRETEDESPPTDAREHSSDGRSVALVSLRSGELTYGVLGVVAAEQNAFENEELQVLEELGQTVGWAIDATESRELLLSESALEFELHTVDDDSVFVRLSERLGCELDLDGIVPVSDGELLYYITFRNVSDEEVKERLDRSPHILEYRVLEDADRGMRFECKVSGESGAYTLIEQGVHFCTAEATEGEGRIVARVTPDTNLRRVIEALRQRRPATELVRKEIVDQTETPPGRTSHGGANGHLTDRQRAALEAAFHAGYFGWPRESTAEEIAASMDISSSTFHYHLRRGLQTVLRAHLDWPEDGAS